MAKQEEEEDPNSEDHALVADRVSRALAIGAGWQPPTKPLNDEDVQPDIVDASGDPMRIHRSKKSGDLSFVTRKDYEMLGEEERKQINLGEVGIAEISEEAKAMAAQKALDAAERVRKEKERRKEYADILRTAIIPQKICFASTVGGVGKTTSSTMLAHYLTRLRGDGVLLLEGNPGGALGHRLGRDLRASASDALRAIDYVQSREDLVPYLVKGADLLMAVGENGHPGLPRIEAEGYERLAAGLGDYFDIVVIDTTTGLTTSPLVINLLDVSDQVVFCSSTDRSSMLRLLRALNWMDQQGGRARELLATMVIALHEVRKDSSGSYTEMRSQLVHYCPRVVVIPFDTHLARGGAINYDTVSTATKQAYAKLAQELGNKFLRAPV